LVRLVIKPDVVGKRIKLMHRVLWDSVPRLTILEGHDDFMMVYDDNDYVKLLR